MKTEFENLERIQNLVYALVDTEEDPERREALEADLKSRTNWFGSIQSIEEFLSNMKIRKAFNWHLRVAQEYIDANPADQ